MADFRSESKTCKVGCWLQVGGVWDMAETCHFNYERQYNNQFNKYS